MNDGAAADDRDFGGTVVRGTKRRPSGSPVAGGATPAAEWTLITSSASARARGGRRPQRRRANMVLPDPGGPTNSRW